MSIHDYTYEIYIVGYSNIDYMNKYYVDKFLSDNNFNRTDILSNADFIYLDPEYRNTFDYVRAQEYAHIECIEVTECLEDLFKLRDESEFNEGVVR